MSKKNLTRREAGLLLTTVTKKGSKTMELGEVVAERFGFELSAERNTRKAEKRLGSIERVNGLDRPTSKPAAKPLEQRL